MAFFLSFIISICVALVVLDMIGMLRHKAPFDDGGHVKDNRGHYIHSDEPLICPLCDTGFYRWQWTEKEDADPTFRKKYYNHVLIADMYRLPCTTCAVDKVMEIKVINGTAWNKQARAWNRMSQAQRRNKILAQPGSSAPVEIPDYLPNMKLWSPEDEK